MKKPPNPSISVIMAVYNGMPYLKDAVKSILNQSYKNFEFIIVNDASTDGTFKYLKNLKDKRIKLIDNLKDTEHKVLLSKDGYYIHKANLENPCKKCAGKAYKGRIGIYEMLEMTDEFEKIILGSLSESAMREEAKRQGMITLYQDGIIKVLKGLISLDELLDVAQAGESA